MTCMHHHTGMRHSTDNQKYKIRPDLTSCESIPARRIEVRLPDPLQTLISATPELINIPYFESKSDANIAMIKEVKREIVMHQRVTESSQLAEIAKPIATQMQRLKPTLVNKLDSYVPLKRSLMLTVIVFIGNLALHILAMYLYHRFAIIRMYVPHFVKKYLPNEPSSEPSVPPLETSTTTTKIAATAKDAATVILPGTMKVVERADETLGKIATTTANINAYDVMQRKRSQSISTLASHRNSLHFDEEITESTT